ncbi:YaiI/YqxD family protein [Sessilibacter sp. MAH2]
MTATSDEQVRKPQIWVDADACPVAVKEVIYKAAGRAKILAVFVANQPLSLPNSPYLKSQQVFQGFDKADDYICEGVVSGDLVITQDIPLAADILEKNAFALHPRGDQYSKETIRAKLKMRDFNETLRASGIHSRGPKSFTAQDKQQFANSLDRWLAKYCR